MSLLPYGAYPVATYTSIGSGSLIDVCFCKAKVGLVHRCIYLMIQFSGPFRDLDLETVRKIVSSDKYIGELDQLSPYKNKRQLKNQIQYWCKLLLDKLHKAKDSLEELLQNDPYINAYIGDKLAKNEEPLSIFEAYKFQLTVRTVS